MARNLLARPAAPPPPQSRRKLPAWLLSVISHAAVLFTLAWLFGDLSELASVPPLERRAAIVLVPRPARERSPGSPLLSAEPASQDRGADQLRAVQSPHADAIGAVLPAADSQPAVAGLQLPEIDGSLPGRSLVTSIGPLGGRGRPKLLPGIDDAAILAEDAARPREATPLGTPANLAFFGTQATGRSFVFVIDRSESMGGSGLGAIDAAAAELAASIGGLSADQYFQVVAYNQAATIYAQRNLMPAAAENKKNLLQFVRNLSAFGGTEHSFGLQAALRMRPEVIYLLTDGGDPIPDALQLRTIREAAAGRMQIHCLHFGSGGEPASGAEFLRRIAGENGGSYTYIDMNKR